MKNLAWISGLLITAAFFVGCGNSKNDNNNQTTAACPVGTYYSNGQCYGIAGPTPAGFTYNTGFYSDNHSGTSNLSIINGQKMKDFYKFGMGVCDRAANNGGLSACDSWISGSLDIVIQFAGANTNSMIATFIARPRYNPYFNYQYQLPSGWGLLGAALGLTTGIWIPDPKYYNGIEKNPLQLQMAVSLINNSAGFEARGQGDAYSAMNGTVLAIQVPNGHIEDNAFNFNFLIGGTPAVQGTMRRCQLMNCGL